MERIYPRDIIAIISLIACFILMFFGINHVVSGIAIAVIAYYFSKRVYEEKHPNGDIEKKVDRLEEEVKRIPKPPKLNIQTVERPPIKQEPLTTGDFKPVPASKPL